MALNDINIGFEPNDGTGDKVRDAFIKVNNNFKELNTNKVNKIVGKGLSTEDYSTAEKALVASALQPVNLATAFNKNFGTTAGTVVEGGTLGSNAYTSTAYLPLSGGDVTGNLNVTGNIGIGTASPTHKFVVSNSGQQGFEVYIESTTAMGIQSYNRSTGSYSLMKYDASSHLFNSNITASPATTDAHLPTLGQVKGITDLKAPLASPALTGTPTAPTAVAGTNTTQIATTEFVNGGLATKENTFSKNTAFNKNFGTAVGTVAEGNYPPAKDGTGASGTWDINISGNSSDSTLWKGQVYLDSELNSEANSYVMGFSTALNSWHPVKKSALGTFLDLGSNAYTSTDYLPLSGGTLTGILNVNKPSLQIVSEGSDQGAIDLLKTGDTRFRLFSDINGFGIYNVQSDVNNLSLNKTTGAATFSSTVSAAPATLSNELVTKGQLDAAENILGSSGSYKPTFLNVSNMDSIYFESATYIRIGSVINVRLSLYVTAMDTSEPAMIDFTLPVPRASTKQLCIGLSSSLDHSTVVATNENTTSARLTYKSLVPGNIVAVMFQYTVDK